MRWWCSTRSNAANRDRTAFAFSTSRPNASMEIVVERYELCEDMASMLTEHAEAMRFNKNLSEDEVLALCHQGLTDEGSPFVTTEAEWIKCRLAELLSWTIF